MADRQIPGYTMLRLIAEGGCAEVWEALEQGSTNKVAVKILHPRNLANKAEHKRLLDEGAIGMRLRNCEHVVHMAKVGKDGKFPYIVMELVNGITLREWLRRNGPMSNVQVVTLAGALGRALRYVHNEGFFHKDLKPDNVMLDGENPIKLLDFGFAESKLGAKFGIFGRKLEGSPAYMAPELLRTKKPTAGSDMYALGCTLYEAATGKPPFTGLSDGEVIAAQMSEGSRAVPVSQVNPKMTIFTEKLIMNALVKNPEQRYKSADEFLLELARNPVISGGSKGNIPAGWTR